MALLAKGDHAGAEPVLRECHTIREKTMPESWLRWNAASMLGEALAGQGRHAEAEPLLLQGYERMEPPDEPIPRRRRREARERIVALYEAWGKPEAAARWRSGEGGDGR
jgi:hypothetical protein